MQESLDESKPQNKTNLFYLDGVEFKLNNQKFRTIAEVKELLQQLVIYARNRETDKNEQIEWQIAKRHEAEKRLAEVNKETKMRVALDLVASHRNISQGIAAVADASSSLTTVLSRMLDK